MNNPHFVSGHLNLTQDEFDQHYSDKLRNAVACNYTIIVGDANGADAMAQKFLNDLGYQNVVVYHMFDKPRINVGNFPTVGGSKTDEERDELMTKNSNVDIAWVRSEEETKRMLLLEGKKYKSGRISGTEKNILRRKIYL
jgi:hypothetical protein